MIIWGSVISGIISCTCIMFRIFSSSEIESVTVSCNIGMLTFVTTQTWDIIRNVKPSLNLKNILSVLQTINSLKNLQPFA